MIPLKYKTWIILERDRVMLAIALNLAAVTLSLLAIRNVIMQKKQQSE